MSAVVLRGDARNLPLPDESVDLIVTSPPYFGQRDYRDGGESMKGQIGSEDTPREYIAALLECTAEWTRVLKPSGSIFVNLGDKYSQRTQTRRSAHQPGIFPGKFPEFAETWAQRAAKGATRMPHQNVIDADGAYVAEKSLMGLPWRYALACMDDLGLILRRDVIWRKVSALPESVTDRCETRHEYLFHFVRHPRYYAAIDEIREPHSAGTHPGRTRSVGNHSGNGVAHRTFAGNTDEFNPLGRLPGSVWEIASVPLNVPEHIEHARCCGGRKRPGCEDGLDHHAAFPPELPRKCILGWAPPGICTACGEGRRPVVNASRTIDGQPVEGLGHWRRGRGEATAGIGNWRFGTRRQRIGYACACTPYTDRPGSGKSTAGRDYNPGQDGYCPQGIYGRKQAGEYERVGPGREYHFDRWTPPPTRPALVVDPFGGTGTTALVASVLGRNAITFDRSADYCRLATWRVNDPAERARALGVPKPPPVPDGQASLFDLEAV